MSLNKYKPHVLIIPEDRADEQIANGFLLHDQVKSINISVMPHRTGWKSVLECFQKEYISYLETNPTGFVILLIDFDGIPEARQELFADEIPDELQDRVFVVGARQNPEELKKQLGKNLEQIGFGLAEDCFEDKNTLWGHAELHHNEAMRLRMVELIRGIVFS